MDEHKILVGKRISATLTRREKTQKELAKHLGVKPNVISYFCNGDRTPNTEQLIKISQFLMVSTDYLLGITDIMTPDQNFKTVCNLTGLSEKSVDSLLYIKEKAYFEILNLALSYDEELEERGELEIFPEFASILKKILEICQTEMKMGAFADAVCDIASVHFNYTDTESTSTDFLKEKLNKIQDDLSGILPERLVYDERFQGYWQYCLQVDIMQFITSLIYEYNCNDDKREKLKSDYLKILKRNSTKLKKYIEELQKHEKESNESFNALIDMLGFDKSFFNRKECNDGKHNPSEE